MVAGGARRVVLTAVVVVVVSGYHAHRPLQRLRYTHPEDGGRPATSQDDSDIKTLESRAKEQRESVRVRLRRYVGDGHIGVVIDQDELGGIDSPRPSIIVCEQLMVLRRTSPAGHTVSCTFSDRLMTPEAKERQLAKWRRKAVGAVQFVSVDVFMEVVEACLGLEESPAPPPPNWTILSLIQIRAPGTLWCGSGQTAQDLAELGAWGAVDHCCRLHDLCPVQLPPFVQYRGAINITPKPLSHCVCDVRFASCLYKINNMRASFIFHTYFNVLFRGGFCATIQPREPRMGFTRGFSRFWVHLVDVFKSMSGPNEEEADKRRRKVVTSIARQMEFTSVFLSTTTTPAASPFSSMDFTPSLTPSPQTMTPNYPSYPSPSPSPSSFSSLFSPSSLTFPVSTITTFHDNNSMTTLQTSKHETALKRLEFTSLLLKLTYSTCIADPLTAPSFLDDDEVSKSVSVISNPLSTPPLPSTAKTNEALPHPRETGDPHSHTYENSPGKRRGKGETSERHREHEAHYTGTREEQEKVVSSRRDNNSSRDKEEQSNNDLQIIPFRRYIEQFCVEEDVFRREKQDEGEEEKEKEEEEEEEEEES